MAATIPEKFAEIKFNDIYHLLIGEDAGLTAAALARTLETKGDHVSVRGLVEFSNICRRNCVYCGLRAQNKNVSRYRLTHAEIMAAATNAVCQGADTIVLQSGEGAAPAAWLAQIVSSLKTDLGVAVALSVGECPRKDYELWRKAGADRYLLKHETADPLLYSNLHPGYSLADRLRCIQELADLGYEIGGGFMVGVPGQSIYSLARDIELCGQLKLAMCGVGPFIPQMQTPCAAWQAGSIPLTLKIISILRLVLPAANLPATTALASLDETDGQTRGLMAGANVLMPSFTPDRVARQYRIYDHKNRVSMQNAAKAIEAAGRTHRLHPD